MSHSARFIALALVGWVALRALSLGMIPGGEALAFDRPAPPSKPGGDTDKAIVPSLATTEFAPLDPVAAAGQPQAYPPGYPSYPPGYGPAYPQGYAAPYPPAYPQAYAMPYGIPVAYAAGRSRGAAVMREASSPALPRVWGPDEAAGFSLTPAAERYAAAGVPLDQWPLEQIAGRRGRRGAGQSTPAALIRSIPGIDRLSMSGWAMMRREPGTPSLASNGQLGGSQAGARILWRFHRDLALSIRSSAPIGGVQRTAELAAGLRYQPFRNIPVAFTAERRQSFGPDKGASAFAFFVEGGVYDRPIVARFNLDAYLQAGVVGIRDHAAFVDGSATLTRPIWRQLSGGVGMWGGAQPGLARFDVGPRLSYRIGRSMRVHVDYRHRLVGKAAPGSGPVLTLAANF